VKLPKIGSRVGALAAQKDGAAFLFGYGTYQGEHVPPDDGPSTSYGSLAHLVGLRVPKIVLDNGDVIWGYECWWGSEEEINAIIEKGKLLVIDITIADFRAGRLPQITPKTDFWTA